MRERRSPTPSRWRYAHGAHDIDEMPPNITRTFFPFPRVGQPSVLQWANRRRCPFAPLRSPRTDPDASGWFIHLTRFSHPGASVRAAIDGRRGRGGGGRGTEGSRDGRPPASRGSPRRGPHGVSSSAAADRRRRASHPGQALPHEEQEQPVHHLSQVHRHHASGAGRHALQRLAPVEGTGELHGERANEES